MRKKVEELVNILFGFRKVLAFFILLFIAVILRVYSLVNGAEFVDLMKNVTISFFAANGVEHIISAVKDFTATKIGPTLEDNKEKESEPNG